LSRRLHKRVGLVLDCCFDPVYGLGDTETAFAALREISKRLRDQGIRQVITGCLNCHKLLSEHLEDFQIVFILEVLPPEIFEKQNMDSVYLHHPCPSSRWEAIRNKAKGLVGHIHPSLGADCQPGPIPDLPVSEANAGFCCGNGGGLNAFHPDLADRFLDRIMEEAENKTIVTYCTGCQNRFLQRGAETVHLLECVPGVKPRRKILSPFRQWTSRFALAMVERLNYLHCFRNIGKDYVAAGNDQQSPEEKLKYIDKCGLSGK
jgi:hypothetical protein